MESDMNDDRENTKLWHTLITVVENNIIDVSCDVVVNSANKYLDIGEGTGVNRAIHECGGTLFTDLLVRIREQLSLQMLPIGQACISESSGDLLARFVIHTVPAVWEGGNKQEWDALYSCYYESFKCVYYMNRALHEHNQNSIARIAFPGLGLGNGKYPWPEAFHKAMEVFEYCIVQKQWNIEHIILAYPNAEKAEYARMYIAMLGNENEYKDNS